MVQFLMYWLYILEYYINKLIYIYNDFWINSVHLIFVYFICIYYAVSSICVVYKGDRLHRV